MAFKGSEVTKDAKKYWRLSKDKGELVWTLKEAMEVRNQEDPGSNRDSTMGLSLGS